MSKELKREAFLTRFERVVESKYFYFAFVLVVIFIAISLIRLAFTGLIHI